MGFKIKIVKTPEELSKADEMNILKELAGAFNEYHGYCKSLLTVEFLRWVGEQIAMDLAPDMWDAYAQCHKERGEQSQDIMKQAAAIRTLKENLETKSDTLAAALKENKELKQKVDAFKSDLEDLDDARIALGDREALCEELQRDKGRLVEEMASLQIAHMKDEARIHSAEQTILRLKARLYDLEHLEEAAPAAGGQDPLRYPYQATA